MAVVISDIKFDDLDTKLQEVAVKDFSLFCEITGVDKTQAYTCLEKAKGKSIRQIANKLRISKGQAESRCKKCPK